MEASSLLMEQIIIKDGKIIEHLDAPELIDGAIEVSDFNGYIGSDKREYDSDWKLLPLHDRVSNGFIIPPKGYRCEGDRFIEMTEVEKVEAGILTLPEGFMIDNGIIRAKTLEERFSSREITEAEYRSLKNDEVISKRRGAYISESDHLFFEEQRGDVPEGTWIKKIEEIKARFPKEI